MASWSRMCTCHRAGNGWTGRRGSFGSVCLHPVWLLRYPAKAPSRPLLESYDYKGVRSLCMCNTLLSVNSTSITSIQTQVLPSHLDPVRPGCVSTREQPNIGRPQPEQGTGKSYGPFSWEIFNCFSPYPSLSLIALSHSSWWQVQTVSTFMVVNFGYDYDMRWWCVLILFAYIVFVRVTSILALKYCEYISTLGPALQRTSLEDVTKRKYLKVVFSRIYHLKYFMTLIYVSPQGISWGADEQNATLAELWRYVSLDCQSISWNRFATKLTNLNDIFTLTVLISDFILWVCV